MDFALAEHQLTLQEVRRMFFEAQVPDSAVRVKAHCVDAYLLAADRIGI